jgi:hypothetical protein
MNTNSHGVRLSIRYDWKEPSYQTLIVSVGALPQRHQIATISAIIAIRQTDHGILLIWALVSYLQKFQGAPNSRVDV